MGGALNAAGWGGDWEVGDGQKDRWVTHSLLCSCRGLTPAPSDPPASPTPACSELGYGPAGKKSSANPDKCLALEGAETLQVLTVPASSAQTAD